jgi:hypothetical protein
MFGMATADQRQLQTFTLRVPRRIADEVRRLAAAEGETPSIIVRRLLRVGLTTVVPRRPTARRRGKKSPLKDRTAAANSERVSHGATT